MSYEHNYCQQQLARIQGQGQISRYYGQSRGSHVAATSEQYVIFRHDGYIVHPSLGVSADLQSAFKKCPNLFVLRGFIIPAIWLLISVVRYGGLQIPVLRGRTFLMPDNISSRTPSGKGRLRQQTLLYQQAFYQILFESNKIMIYSFNQFYFLDRIFITQM